MPVRLAPTPGPITDAPVPGGVYAPSGAVLLAIAISVVVVFAIDCVTPLGFATWTFYMLPVALSVWAGRPALPLQLAGLATVLLWAGYLASPPGGAEPPIPELNRVFMVVVLWCVAALCRLVVVAAARERDVAWVQAGEAAVAQAFLEDRPTAELGDAVLRALVPRAGAALGALHLLEDGRLRRVGGYALAADGAPADGAAPDQGAAPGVPMQVVRDGRIAVLRDLGPGHLVVESGLGRSGPSAVLVAPTTADGRVTGVLELGFVGATGALDRERALLAEVAERIGTGLRSARQREREQALLAQTREQADTLRRQQDELRSYTEELEAQSRALQDSQARLETQQAELEQTNAELEAQAASLERERSALADAQRRLGDYTSRLEAESRYKSEFLANMSHELRTPLNSALILAKLLADNRGGRLDAEEVRWARTILSANNDLLVLINDILDLSKIEAGRLEVVREPMGVDGLVDSMRAAFEPVAAQRGVAFGTRVDPGVPANLVSDPRRVAQVLRNFLSNAFKFTERGRVGLAVRRVGDTVALDVEDTGIGIPADQHALIFEAFRQADGTTARRYGGTGLGLTISRELARLLGGRVELDSAPGRGSRFTLVLPIVGADAVPVAGAGGAAIPPAGPTGHRDDAHPADDGSGHAELAARAHPAAGTGPRGPVGRGILVVEDDPTFADLVAGVVRDAGFEAACARTAAQALDRLGGGGIAAVLLDVGLPDESGLALLERLKREPATRHLPIHVISASDHRQTAFGLGAAGYALKPVDRDTLVETLGRLRQRLEDRVRRVLVVEDDARLRDGIATLLGGDGVEVVAAGTLAEAGALLERERPDCIVLDLVLPDGSGYDFLERHASAGAFAAPPIIVYTGRSITPDEEQRLRRYSSSIIVKGARSPERLLDEVTLFLHQVESDLPAAKRRMLEHARARDARLDGRRVLLAEDDARNVFALASALEPLGVELVVARNGNEAIERLERRHDIDLVLMDVMMPELDGLAATRLIRARPEWARLPVIALTAKAMPEDRLACMEAGANDYVSKPIDVGRLVSLLRVWLPA